MSTKSLLPKKPFALLKEENLDPEISSEVSAAEESEDAQPLEAVAPTAKPKRVYTKLQVKDFNERQIARAEKAVRELEDTAKEAVTAEKKRADAEKKAIFISNKVTKIFTPEEIAAYQERQARRAAGTARVPKVFTPEEVAEYQARVARRAAGHKVYTPEEKEARKAEHEAKRLEDRGAYLERATKRAIGKDAFEQRKLKREERAFNQALFQERQQVREDNKAAFEERETRREEKAKKLWIRQCLVHKRCFNCSGEDHISEKCPETPFEGSYQQ